MSETANETTSAPAADAAAEDVLFGDTGDDAPKGDGLLGDQEPEAKAEPAKGEAKVDAKSAAPEKYEFKLPDGQIVDQTAAEAAQAVFREAGLSQEHAQKIVDLYVRLDAQRAAANLARHAEDERQWMKDLREDKDLGGANYEASIKAARRALRKFGDTDLQQILVSTGLHKHRALVRLFVKVAKATGEDAIAAPAAAASAPRTPGEILFGNPQAEA